MALKLPYPLVNGLSDAQQNFDRLSVVFKNFAGLDFGKGSVTFSASTNAAQTVTHRLGVVPVAVLVVPAQKGGITPYVGTVDDDTPPTATQFVARLFTNPSSTTVTNTTSFYWAVFA